MVPHREPGILLPGGLRTNAFVNSTFIRMEWASIVVASASFVQKGYKSKTKFISSPKGCDINLKCENSTVLFSTLLSAEVQM